MFLISTFINLTSLLLFFLMKSFLIFKFFIVNPVLSIQYVHIRCYFRIVPKDCLLLLLLLSLLLLLLIFWYNFFHRFIYLDAATIANNMFIIVAKFSNIFLHYWYSLLLLLIMLILIIFIVVSIISTNFSTIDTIYFYFSVRYYSSKLSFRDYIVFIKCMEIREENFDIFVIREQTHLDMSYIGLSVCLKLSQLNRVLNILTWNSIYIHCMSIEFQMGNVRFSLNCLQLVQLVCKNNFT